VPGEKSSPTQPFPLKPLPYARQRLTAEMLTRRTPEANAFALWAFAGLRNDGPFAPLALDRQTIVFPGFDGGAEWGGPAVDRKRAIIYINSNDLAWTGGLAAAGDTATLAARLYAQHCSACHGLDRQGSPPQFPPLADVASHLSRSDILAIVRQGRGRMPGFPQLAEEQVQSLAALLLGGAEAKREANGSPGNRPYSFTGYRKFLDPEGYPAVAPPWGTLNAIDLNSGEYVWKIPLGEYPELAAAGQADTGSENYGGPLVTAGNVLFIGATLYDQKFRAFDSLTGKLLWETRLPFAGMAAPITYAIGGRQFVVIATSNARNPKGQRGSAYVALALPEKSGR
jgi:quinoprotein glucose dehydrogenase